MIVLIAAIDTKRALGKDNQLLWHLPNDLKRFKQRTLNQPIIMGRKTFESLPGILPHRTHIILSHNSVMAESIENVYGVSSIEEAIQLGQKYSDTLFIIGGGAVYEQFLPIADALEITLVHTEQEADTFFPEIPHSQFIMTHREFHPKDEKHPYAYEFLSYQKIRYADK